MMKPSTPLALKIAQLPELEMKALWALWDELFESRPQHHQRAYLERRIAYRLQEQAYGGLSATTRQKLERIGETGHVPSLTKQADSHIAAGTQLVREYDGQTHRVTVLPDGRFDYQGQAFKSLTAIAKFITGTPWSGPVFFGLKKTQRKTKGGGA